MNSKPIIITGSHRSGTTWIGKIIATHPRVCYIHEPFNIQFPDLGLFQPDFNCWYKFINDKNGHRYKKDLDNIFNLNYNLTASLSSSKNTKEIAKSFYDYLNFNFYKQKGGIPLIKDPFLLFSLEWLEDNFNIDILITIRHPAAFAGSLKIKNWKFPFDSLSSQKDLLENKLKPFKDKIIQYSRKEQDIIDQSILLWNIIHYSILEYKKKFNDKWIFIKHEDLSKTPEKEFGKIFEKIDLDFPLKTIKQIKKNSYSSANKNSDRNISANDIRRNSLENIKSWKSRLNKEEIQKIKNGTKEIWPHFYTEKDWL